jgi:type IV pilus assembly protein PilC
MAKFTYTALNREGKKETSTIEAANLVDAGHLLKEQGLTPTDFSEVNQSLFAKVELIINTISLTEKITFIQNLSIMLKAGIAAPRALKIIAKQTKNKKFRSIISDISHDVEAGKPLHEAMTSFPRVFSYIFISMIKVGEISGDLDKSLEYLVIQLEREADLKSKTKGAMIYPMVIIGAMIVISILMSIFVLPKLISVFEQSNVALPITTKIVIFLTHFMSNHTFLALGSIVGFFLAVILILRSDSGKKGLDTGLIYFPILSTIIKKINMARFARILSSLLKSGIPIVEGLQVASDSMGNHMYHDVVAEASESVRLGKPLTEVLAKNERLFPFIVVQMLEVGEETGTLESILEQLAQHYEAQVDSTLKNLSSIIEPLLLLFIGSLVGLLASALILPIYNLGSTIQ